MAVTFGRLYYDDKNYWVMDDVPPHVRIKLKSVFSFLKKTQVNPYLFPNKNEVCKDLSWFISRYPMEISDDDFNILKSGADAFDIDQVEKEDIFKKNYVFKDFKFKDNFSLRDYQKQAVALYLKQKKYLLGDSLGLGKTIVAIGCLANRESLPALVVVQTHLVNQWKEQIEKFTDLRVCIVDGYTPKKLKDGDVYITKYGCLSPWVDVLSSSINFKSIIFDEVQELRKSDSNKYRAAKIITENIDYILGMSGTPIYNYGDEIWNIMNIISPGSIGNFGDFSREWCGYGKEVLDPKALGSYLRSNHLFLRRTPEDVGRELPQLNTIVHTVPCDEKALHEIENDAKALALKVMQGSFIERGQASRELDMMVRKATGVAKAKYVAQYVKILLDNGEPVVLAAWHRSVYEIFEKEFEGYNPVFYTGTESASAKNSAKEDFVSGKSNLFIISLRSGVGLDGLQYSKCKYVIIAELDWSPKVHEQLIGRVNRDGQTDQVTVIYLVTDSGSDPAIIQVLGVKDSQSQGIVDPFKSLEVKVSDDSRVKLLAQSFLDRSDDASKAKKITESNS